MSASTNSSISSTLSRECYDVECDTPTGFESPTDDLSDFIHGVDFPVDFCPEEFISAESPLVATPRSSNSVHRSRKSSNSVSYARPTPHSHHSYHSHHSLKSSFSFRPQQVRVVGLQRGSTDQFLVQELSETLSDDERDIQMEATIVPSISEDTEVGLVGIGPRLPGFLKALNGPDGRDDVQIRTKYGVLSIDMNFYGLTQLYPVQDVKKIAAE
jgi:hypothetical protein